MPTLTKKNFDSPDETMTPPKTRVDNVDLGNGQSAARIKEEPGMLMHLLLDTMVR